MHQIWDYYDSFNEMHNIPKRLVQLWPPGAQRRANKKGGHRGTNERQAQKSNLYFLKLKPIYFNSFL